MTKPMVAALALAVAVVAAACAGAGGHRTDEPAGGRSDGVSPGADAATSSVGGEDAARGEPARAQDPCHDFNARRQGALSGAEHTRRYGCPPCPCSCSNGKIVCAPCVRCDPVRPLPDPREPPSASVE